MTCDSTYANFLQFSFSIQLKTSLLTNGPDLRSEMPELGSLGPPLRPELRRIWAWMERNWSNEGLMSDFGSGRSDLWSDRPASGP